MGKIYIMRGLPGSGKSTTIRKMIREDKISKYTIASADSFFMEGDKYCYKPALIGQAHEYCKKIFYQAIMANVPVIFVDNTNVRRWEYELYAMIGEDRDYDIYIINCYDGFCTDSQLAKRNKHGVPIQAISRMREMFEKEE